MANGKNTNQTLKPTQGKAAPNWAGVASGKNQNSTSSAPVPSSTSFPAPSSTPSTVSVSNAPSGSQSTFAKAAGGGKNSPSGPLPTSTPAVSNIPSAANSPVPSAVEASRDVVSTTAALASTSLGGPVTSKQPGDKKAAPSKDAKGPGEKKPKRPEFCDAEYATSDELGNQGTSVKARVNRFEIHQKYLPVKPKFFVYSIALPTINDHEVTSASVKKIMIRSILQTSVLASANSQDKLFTDWNSELVTVEPLSTLREGDLDDDGSWDPNREPWEIKFPFQNQTAAVATEVIAKITRVHELNFSEFSNYLHGHTAGNFDHGLFVRVFNIMARHYAAQNAIRVGGNRIFSTQNGANALSSGLFPRQGFFNSVRPARGGFQLQMNSSTTAFFPRGDLVTFLRGYFGQDFRTNPATPQHFAALEKLRPELRAMLCQVQVRYKYNPPDSVSAKARSVVNPNGSSGRLKRITGLGMSAATQFFTYQGNDITVQDHFDQHVLQRPLQYPHLPVINVGSTDPGDETWIPMELLWIEDHQYHRGKVPDQDMRSNGQQGPPSMPEVSRHLPLDNVQLIEGQGLRMLDRQALDSRQIMAIDPQMMVVDGRVLPLPKIKCQTELGKFDDLARADGKWMMKGKTFTEGRELKKFLVIKIGRKFPDDETKFDGLQTELSRLGVTSTGRPQIKYSASANDDDLDRAWSQFNNPGDTSAVLVVMDGQLNTYSRIKRWGDIHKGLNTVCLKEQNMRKLVQPGFQANLALKYNAKLGGQNFRLTDSFLKTNLHFDGLQTMVVGADVVHPSQASVEGCPSIASVVASVNQACVNFPGSMRLQAGRREDIEGMCDMMKERLRMWASSNKGQLPGRILFYRDGVSENQFSIVKRVEIQAIERACSEIAVEYRKASYKPPITAVVCTKRHQTRFYPNKGSTPDATLFDSEMRFKPGLVVDDPRIRLPKYVDFWLQAQQPLQGTGRPCHYFVLENQIKMTPNQLQNITYGLSWIYATSLTPVSLAAPAYYADKLCERGRRWMLMFFTGRHFQREKAKSFIRQIPGFERMTDDQKRVAAAAHIASTNNGPWPRSQPNPCHDRTKNTMFYV